VRAATAFQGAPPRVAANGGSILSAAGVPWGFAEFFIISQTAIPALLYLPGTQPFRLYIRVASFGISLAALIWWAFTRAHGSRRPVAQPWVIATIAYLTMMMVHPGTTSQVAGLAQLVLYLSVMAPMFWAGSFVRSPDHLARLIALLLICNGLNSMVGVLQVYDPARWMPQELSRVMEGQAFGMATVTYQGPDGRMIVRPPGLFDSPGAVAGPGMFAALLGLVFAISALPAWQRILALGASFAGVAAIYLSQVRVSLVVSALMFVTYVLVLGMQRRRARASLFALVAGGLLVATFSFALILGGESVAERTMTLFADDPVALYQATRGNQLAYTFTDLLQRYPMGAGLGRWGMIAAYFGNAAAGEESLFAEIQVAGWAIDGGFPLLVVAIGALAVTLAADATIARTHPDAKTRACAAVVVAANIGTAALIFTFTPFVTQIGVQFWFLVGALHGVVHPARRAHGR
jgi:hypothetical protein